MTLLFVCLAVVECDSVSTAERIYAECDGMEFARTACRFDLRFVPDGQDFSQRAQRDATSSVPADYAPPVFFNKVRAVVRSATVSC